MKFKNLGALFLLSLASIYFICPVQCAASPEAGGAIESIKVLSHQQHRIDSQTVGATNPAACCDPESQPTPPHQNHRADEGHCCLNQWESLGTSEPQLALHIQKDTCSLVVLIPTTPEICSGAISFIYDFQHSYNPYTYPPIPQLSPRAPPFSLT